MVSVFVLIIISIVVLAGGFIAGSIYRKKEIEKKIGEAETYAQDILTKASSSAEEKRREAVLAAREEVLQLRNDLEREIRDRRSEVTRQERRINQREEQNDRKAASLDERENQLNERNREIEKNHREVTEMKAREQAELERIALEEKNEMERIAGMTTDEAKDQLVDRIQRDAYREAAVMVRDIEQNARDDAEKKARNIISAAIQRCAADYVVETTVSVVALPNDDMKGRIIGREGRNIRTLETATGVDLIIDDTPEAVIISAYDPVRREVARTALEHLITDGRIHPARIEEIVEKSRREVENLIREAGEQACFETGLHGIHPELMRALGRMRYRTSYGQNVLNHSIEVSHLAGVMAAELGVDVQLAKRAGLLHDIGKSSDSEMEGTHVSIGADLARKYHESELVINAIEAHHNDKEPISIEAVLVQAADAISAARPGARRESLENYIKRLQKLEEIAKDFDGVDTCYAIQSGRELRIIVKPDDVNDAGAIILAKEIVKRIEKEMEYPGQIKVNVIRETRATEYAK